MNEFERAKIDRETNCKNVTAAQILALVADDIQRGEVVADGILIVCVRRHPGGSVTHERYRAGLGRDEEYVACSLAAHACLNEWLA